LPLFDIYKKTCIVVRYNKLQSFGPLAKISAGCGSGAIYLLTYSGGYEDKLIADSFKNFSGMSE